MNYFKSEQVKVFPCSSRGMIEDSTTNSSYTIDLESKLNTEYNLTHIPSTISGKENFIISCNKRDSEYLDAGNIDCSIGGYHFVINVATTDIPTSGNWFFIIKLKPAALDTKNTTWILENINNTSATKLDDKDNNIYYFYGLKCSTVKEESETETEKSISLQILEGGKLCTKSFYRFDPKVFDAEKLTFQVGSSTTYYGIDKAATIKGGTDITLSKEGTNSILINATPYTNGDHINISNHVVAVTGIPVVSVSGSGSPSATEISYLKLDNKEYKILGSGGGSVGPTGPGFYKASATIDANTGTPTVTTSITGTGENRELKFSFQNLKGPKGDKGDQGTGVSVKASAAECTKIGDAYINQENGHLMILTSLDPKTFTDGGQIKGPQGDTGPTGPTGAGITEATATIGTEINNPTVTVTVLDTEDPAKKKLKFEFDGLVGPTGAPGGGGGSYTAGTNIDISGNTISVTDNMEFKLGPTGTSTTYWSYNLGPTGNYLEYYYDSLISTTYYNNTQTVLTAPDKINLNSKSLNTTTKKTTNSTANITPWSISVINDNGETNTKTTSTLYPAYLSTPKVTITNGAYKYSDSPSPTGSFGPTGNISINKIITTATGATVEKAAELVKNDDSYLLNAKSALYFLPKINGSRGYNEGTNFWGPTGLGKAGQVLSTDGNELKWANPGGGGSLPTSPGEAGHVLISGTTDNNASWTTYTKITDVTTGIVPFGKLSLFTKYGSDTTSKLDTYEIKPSSADANGSTYTFTLPKKTGIISVDSNYGKFVEDSYPPSTNKNDTSATYTKLTFNYKYPDTDSKRDTYNISIDPSIKSTSAATYTLYWPNQDGTILATKYIKPIDYFSYSGLQFSYTYDNKTDNYIVKANTVNPTSTTYKLNLPAKNGTLAITDEIQHLYQHNITIAKSSTMEVYLSILTNSTALLDSHDNLVNFLDSATKIGSTTKITEMGANGIIAGSSSSYLIYKIVKENSTEGWKIKTGTIEKLLSTYKSGYTFTDSTYAIL